MLLTPRNRQGLYRAYPTAWIFLSCPPDPSERCISPGFYAVLGASAMLGGVTRMTSKHLCLNHGVDLNTLIYSFLGRHSF